MFTPQVPGVTESRPSVLRGDHLFALLSSETHQKDPITYKGFVHKVELDRVKLSFSMRWVWGNSSLLEGGSTDLSEARGGEECFLLR